MAMQDSRGYHWVKTCFIAILGCGLLWAQDPTATLSGTVSAENGMLLETAELQVTHLNTGRIWKLLTDSRGTYTASGLPSGSYVLEISTAGYRTSVMGMQLAEGEDGVANFVLRYTPDREKTSPPELPAGEEPATEVPAVASTKAPISAGKPTSPPEASTEPEPLAKSPTPGPTAKQPANPEGFQLQVAALRDRIPAEKLKTLLAGAGYPAYVTEVDLPSGRHFRVRVGPFETAELAQQAGSKLKRLFPKQISGLWIIH